ncbi:hypothetical protein HD806DRAFT_495553 [Xylariaceae sp. AK1471]|nr:hypothetical protein HD806DRAFT_495553 [Xylariaceae sp. AK1471]
MRQPQGDTLSGDTLSKPQFHNNKNYGWDQILGLKFSGGTHYWVEEHSITAIIGVVVIVTLLVLVLGLVLGLVLFSLAALSHISPALSASQGAASRNTPGTTSLVSPIAPLEPPKSTCVYGCTGSCATDLCYDKNRCFGLCPCFCPAEVCCTGCKVE